MQTRSSVVLATLLLLPVPAWAQRGYVGVTVGFGTTRVFGGDGRGGSYAIPNLRLLNVGFAF